MKTITPDLAQQQLQRKVQKRPNAVPVLRRRGVRVTGALFLLGLVAGSATWAVSSGLVQTTVSRVESLLIDRGADAGLMVREILVEGRAETDPAVLLSALGLNQQSPMLGFDPKAARERVRALPWVADARIERRLPDTIYIHLIERSPLALWQHDDTFTLIDDGGVSITDEGIGRFDHLPVVVGADAPQHAADILAVLATEPTMNARVKAVVRVGGRRWNVRLDNGVDVQLPEQDAAAAWARLARYDQDYQVLARDIRIVDLRLPDRLVVRRTSVPPPEPPRTKGRDA